MEKAEVSRNRSNPGRRAREAGKRRRRARVWSGTLPGWLKLGRKHFRRWTGFSMLWLTPKNGTYMRWRPDVGYDPVNSGLPNMPKI